MPYRSGKYHLNIYDITKCNKKAIKSLCFKWTYQFSGKVAILSLWYLTASEIIMLSLKSIRQF